jgi:hypothetical protein
LFQKQKPGANFNFKHLLKISLTNNKKLIAEKNFKVFSFSKRDPYLYENFEKN